MVLGALSANVDVDVLRGPSERFVRRDPFHITKVGILGYLIASSVMLRAQLRSCYCTNGQVRMTATLYQREHALTLHSFAKQPTACLR